MKKTLGACMIVKNEESCLAKCLESIKGIDEIVILDTGSTDKTAEVARLYTDRFIEGVYEWEDDFSKARNKALEYATADWILIIDADETLSPGSLDKIRDAIENADDKIMAIRLDVVSANDVIKHKIVRVHRRHADVYWKGAAHNYLTIQRGIDIDAVITYGYSDAHKLDPDRTLRILTKAVEENPDKPREIYYLAREYFAREDYAKAKELYDKYLTVAVWPPEIADAHLMIAKCAVGLGDVDRAWLAAFMALQINADLSEALKTLAALSGECNRKTWLKYAAVATDEKALFVRDIPGLEEVQEMPAEYYREAFTQFPDMTRYREIYKMVASMCEGRVLDMGCGTGELRKFMPESIDYKGFDFSGVASGDCFEVGNIYDYPLAGYDTYICLEVLEHVDDIAVIERIPSGSSVIFSVPSFPDPAHIRTYTLESMLDRYRDYIDDVLIRRYNWIDGRWIDSDIETEQYILLVKAVRR